MGKQLSHHCTRGSLSWWKRHPQDFCWVTWRLRRPPKLIQATGVLFISILWWQRKEGFKNTVKERRLQLLQCVSKPSTWRDKPHQARASAQQQLGRVSSLRHLCASEGGTMFKKGCSISAASVQDSPNKDKYPLKEIQELSGTDKRIWAKEYKFTNKTSE